MKAFVATVVVLACAGCKPQMGDQPKYEAYEASDFFPDGAAMRPLPAHTVPRTPGSESEAFSTGMRDGHLVNELPVALTRALLDRGRERFNIYCAVCHGFSGGGDGMIVQRGFPAPDPYHTKRLREAPVGYFFEVMTRGYGAMYSYASRVTPEDRWAIAAYIQALQLSQNATLDDVPAGERERLENQPTGP